MIGRLALVFMLPLAAALSAAQSTTPPTASGGFVEVGGSKLWYEECGSAREGRPAVVLLHDGLVHSVTWDDVWAPLCATYHVVRYDRRGYGRSEAAGARFVPEDDLERVMRQVKMDRAILIGNSSGAGLALDFELAHPERVAAMLLIGPVVHGMPSSAYFSERGARNSAPLAKGDAKATAENWSEDRFLIAGDDRRARGKLYDALVQAPQNLKVAGELEIRPSPPSVGRLSEIKVPTLILVGEADIGDVFAYSGAIEAAVPLAAFEIWKDTGHLIQMQRPAELVSRFNRFVALAQRGEVMLSVPQLSEHVGRYELSTGAASVVLKQGRLVLEIPGEPDYWLFAASATRFFLRTEETEIEFRNEGPGRVAEMVIHNDDGSVIRCSRLGSQQGH